MRLRFVFGIFSFLAFICLSFAVQENNSTIYSATNATNSEEYIAQISNQDLSIVVSPTSVPRGASIRITVTVKNNYSPHWFRSLSVKVLRYHPGWDAIHWWETVKTFAATRLPYSTNSVTMSYSYTPTVKGTYKAEACLCCDESGRICDSGTAYFKVT